MQRNARKLDQNKGHFLGFSRLPPIKKISVPERPSRRPEKKSQLLRGRSNARKKTA
jgi:hypothetical protein